MDSFSDKKSDLGLRSLLLHCILLCLTFLTTTLAGVQWLNKDPAELAYFSSGYTYAILIMLVLCTHEMGHYVAARLHKVDATLPYFIPFPSFWGLVPFGTLGAVIRLKAAVPSRKAMFDIGSAGPIAGFIVSVFILIVGFRTLPPVEYLYSIHPEYARLAKIPTEGLTFGNTFFYWVISGLAPQGSFVPPMNEIYHYPFLCVGWFGLLVTAMNLIPIGQLDGGHIVYSMFGVHYHRIAQAALVGLVIIGSLGFLPLLGIQFAYGWPGWLMWALVLILFMRGATVRRSPIDDESPLDVNRLIVGWFCIVIFLGSFSLAPFTLEFR